MDDTNCACGAYKKPEFEQCYTCHQHELKENNELCSCGGRKKADKETCLKCALEKARAEGKLCPKCERAIVRDPEQHKECYKCFKSARGGE